MKPLFVTIVGSKLYGTSIPESDIDFKGFCFPEISEILGLNTFDQMSFNNNVEDGPDKKEGQIYSIKKFFHMSLIKCNPTALEICFAPKKFHLFSIPIGLEICDFIKNNCVTKKLFKPYNAYHLAQIRKLQSMNRIGKRSDIIKKHGYDIKFAMHAYRLGVQACHAMTEGIIQPNLEDRELEIALNLRNGVYTLDEALKILENIDKDMYNSYKNSTLIEEPDYKKINSFLIDIQKRYILSEFDKQLINWKPF